MIVWPEFSPSSIRKRMAPDWFVLTASAILPIFLTMLAGSRTRSWARARCAGGRAYCFSSAYYWLTKIRSEKQGRGGLISRGHHLAAVWYMIGPFPEAYTSRSVTQRG